MIRLRRLLVPWAYMTLMLLVAALVVTWALLTVSAVHAARAADARVCEAKLAAFARRSAFNARLVRPYDACVALAIFAPEEK